MTPARGHSTRAERKLKMKFNVNAKEFMKAIKTVTVIKPARNPNIITNVVKISADGKVKLMYTNTIETIIQEIENAEAEFPMSVYIPMENLVKLPFKDGMLDVEIHNGIAKFSCGSTVINIRCLDIPEQEIVTAHGKFATVKQGEFVEALARTAPAIAKSDPREMLTQFCLDDGNIVALDGYRMHVQEVEVDYDDYNNKTMVIRGSAHKALKKLSDSKHWDSEIDIENDEKYANFWGENSMGKFLYTFRKLDGTFISWQKVLPKDFAYGCNIPNTMEFANFATAMNKTANENRVFFQFGNKLAYISFIGEEMVQGETEIVSTLEKSVPICANALYIKDALNAAESNAWVYMNTSISPIVIKDDTGFTGLVLPIRAYNEDADNAMLALKEAIGID